MQNDHIIIINPVWGSRLPKTAEEMPFHPHIVKSRSELLSFIRRYSTREILSIKFVRTVEKRLHKKFLDKGEPLTINIGYVKIDYGPHTEGPSPHHKISGRETCTMHLSRVVMKK